MSHDSLMPDTRNEAQDSQGVSSGDADRELTSEAPADQALAAETDGDATGALDDVESPRDEGLPGEGPVSGEVRGSIEALLYAASDPLSLRELAKILTDVPGDVVKQALQELLELYQDEGRGLQIMEVAGGYQIATRPEYHDRVSMLFKVKPPPKLSIQALETLAAIAYRQPITVPEIMELRGVRSASVVRTLLEKKLIRIMGRKPVVGRPLLYGTTRQFLLRFGLKDLRELPRLEDMAEIFGDEVALHMDETPEKLSFDRGSTEPAVSEGADEDLTGAASAAESRPADEASEDTPA